MYLIYSSMIRYILRNKLGSGRGTMGRAWVFQTRGPVFDTGGLRWCQEGHPTSNAPVPH